MEWSGPPITVIGDVHGDVDRLRRAVSDSLDQDDRETILLGDYINRGPSSRDVLQFLVECAAGSERLTLLRGNHETALISFLDGGALADFVAHGGMATMHSYLRWEKFENAEKRFRFAFPLPHRQLIEKMESHYESDSVLISHSGFDVNNVLSRSPNAMCGNGDRRIFSHTGPWPKLLTVCGHYVQRSGRPYMGDHLVCVDTGCGTLKTGRLTALRLPELSFTQY